MRLFTHALAVLGLLTAVTTANAQKKPASQNLEAAIDPVVKQMMTEWHVPGLAVGVVKNGQIIFTKGYGYRDIDKQLPVTPKTLMAIGSNTKSFTVVLLGQLVDQGKIAWDTPVRTYLPTFQMFDEYAGKSMTPRDLVSHRSGLPRHDFLWYGRHYTRPELVDRLRYLRPTHGFREVWQYQNLMFATAGYLAETISGQPWDRMIRDQIFTPLGMTRSLPDTHGFVDADDRSIPYSWRNNAITAVPVRSLDAAGPAGSIVSTVDDMLKYVQFRMAHGRNTSGLHLSVKNEDEMQSAQMVVPGAGYWPGFDLVSYGLGLAVASYRGHRAIAHGGSIDGFISQMSWLPDDSIGVVVLSNRGDDNPIPTMVVQAIYDRILGLPPIDYIAKQKTADAETAHAEDSTQAALRAGQKKGTQPSHELSAYVGSYTHPGYGTALVKLVNGNLEVSMDDLIAPTTHYHYDTFELGDAKSLVPLKGLMSFGTNTKGEIDRLLLPLEPTLAPIVFTRSNK